MKRIGIYLAHPAHFHLFKNVIKELRKKNNVFVVYNDKDVLHELVESSDFKHISHRIKTSKEVTSKRGLYFQFVLKNIGALKIFYKLKPDIVAGTPILIALLGKILRYKSIIVNEDDFDIVKKTADFGYPYANHILCPEVCRTTKFSEKSIKYNSYHELAYLHPNHFKADKNIAAKYVNTSSPYFILRFAKLTAHHDDGISGINNSLANKIIEILKPHGNIYITSERKLSKSLEPYRINIHAKDMHHVMAFAKIYIGDSQTMAAEAGVLGTPFIRFNDFIGKISYLDELENVYKLGFGISTDNINGLMEKIKDMVVQDRLQEEFQKRREKMLSEKINYATFLSWFLENYPKSVSEFKEDAHIQYKFL